MFLPQHSDRQLFKFGVEMNGLLFGLSLVSLVAISAPAQAEQKPTPPPPLPPFYRIELEPADGVPSLSIEKDQVLITVRAIDHRNFKDDPSLSEPITYVDKKGVTVPTHIPACSLPFFRVTIENRSGQTLKINGPDIGGPDEVIVAAEDDKEVVIEAKRRSETDLSKSQRELRSWAESAAGNPAEAIPKFLSALEAISARSPYLSGRANILPGKKATFFACFDWAPGATSEKAAAEPFKTRKTLSLGIYDLPVERDEGGIAKKKTFFNFKFNVGLFEETFEWIVNGDRWGTKLVSRKQIN